MLGDNQQQLNFSTLDNSSLQPVVTSLDNVPQLYPASLNATGQGLRLSASCDDVTGLRHFMACVVNPGLASVGLLGNLASVAILARCGLHKATNVLLLTLAAADAMYLLGAVSFENFLSSLGQSDRGALYTGWRQTEPVAFFCFLVDRLLAVVTSWGSYVSTSVPAAIIIERCLAVYRPLHFRSWVTPRAAWTVMAACYVFWLPWALLSTVPFSFWYICLSDAEYFGYYTPSDFTQQNINFLYIVAAYMLNYLGGVVPVTVSIIGSLFIGAKVKSSARMRKRLSGSKVSHSSHVTRTLVTVSLVFAVVNICYYVITSAYKDDLINGTETGYDVIEFQSFLLVVCSSSNFFVYVVSDPKFRLQLDQAIVRWCCRLRSKHL
ncbi:neuropeptides capa receptor-like [Physella acuta]|uniref:neuropeptides capa receptor-like n=1 Tax=Physella acuta TaxID=109671 RepID=UPI0027DD718B|nr:neuropeptides capa receptor-like [Physella acuta]